MQLLSFYFRTFLTLTLLLANCQISLAADDIVLADFEGPNYGDWKAEGTAFGNGPARGTLPGQMPVSGYLGKGLVNSFHDGDKTTGTLTSPEFKVDRKFLRFLIGGGGWESKTCMNLLVNGKIVRTATGPNTAGGGTEELSLGFWDVSELSAKTARLQIVDQESGGWGHINIDQIVLSDQQPPQPRFNAKHELVGSHQWLLFPIKNGGPKRKVTVVLDGAAEVALDMELADGDVDWWAPRDISMWKGRPIQIIVDKLPVDSRAFASIKQSDVWISADPIYSERLRPQIHFSPRRGWNNDPNGMVFFEGTYHLFFQHNPYGWSWGNMHWGHATSRDMVHWEERDETLYPDKFGPMFSGSGVVDWKNTSEFGKGGVPPIVLMYTAAGDPTVQCLAYSTDKGQTFVKYEKNPVVKQITPGNRDPKVIYHEPTKQWVMTLYVERRDTAADGTQKPPIHTIDFFTSPDLKEWKQTCRIDGFFECPDFFPLDVDGDAKQTKWVLTAASSEYMIGSFDGQIFVSETGKLQGHRGRGFYAAQTYSDLPKNRRVQVGWLQAESPGMAFNQAMSIPLDLSLIKTNDGPRLRWQPANELQSLRNKSHQFKSLSLKPNTDNPLKNVQHETLEIIADFKPSVDGRCLFDVRGVSIEYDAAKQELSINGHKTSVPLRDGQQKLHIFTDRTVFEIFAADGLVYVPFPVIPKAENQSVKVSAASGSVEFANLVVHELNSIWQTKSK